jgi:fumarate hydratase subunit alpha
MRILSDKEIYTPVLEMIKDSSVHLPDDVLQALQYHSLQECHETGREILRQLLENARLARETGLPLCQDTGIAVFFIEVGQECHIEGSLSEILNRAMVDAYEQAFLTRQNTGDNSPACIHTELIPGDSLKIAFMAKGGGSENMSQCVMLTPAQGWQGIKDFVLQRVLEAGPNPCPPIIVGLGIGGSFDRAPILAKKALFRPLDRDAQDPEIQRLETELLQEINASGIGPMGLGGKTTCLGVRIVLEPCHIASLPVAVNIQCHASRRQEVVL